ncbi:MAG: hypothetical protein ACK47F_01225, partial [Flavobacteriales bacterium]
MVENTFINGLFRGVYQQITAFINKKAVFFLKSLVQHGYSDIFVSIINYKHSKNQNYEQSR